MAALNLGMSLALTPALGLNGVVLGTTIPYILCAPIILILTVREFDVTYSDFVARVWRPVFTLALPFTIVLVAARLLLPLNSVLSVAAVTGGAVLGYWIAFYILHLDSGEQLLVRSLIARRVHAA